VQQFVSQPFDYEKRITASLGFRSAEGACRTIEGYEAMHAIRKGQVRWVAKGDPVAQREFIHTISVLLRSSLAKARGR
jgi:hypothetical protein